jgi:AAA domain (Cdc48 subfamily)
MGCVPFIGSWFGGGRGGGGFCIHSLSFLVCASYAPLTVLALGALRQGRTVDFKNTLIIMTSNVGSSVIEKGGGGLGFQLDTSEEDSSYNRIKVGVRCPRCACWRGNVQAASSCIRQGSCLRCSFQCNGCHPRGCRQFRALLPLLGGGLKPRPLAVARHTPAAEANATHSVLFDMQSRTSGP